jgi:hypothetical protein
MYVRYFPVLNFHKIGDVTNKAICGDGSSSLEAYHLKGDMELECYKETYLFPSMLIVFLGEHIYNDENESI